MKKDLVSALDSHELIVLRIIGEWLDLNLTGELKRDCVRLLGQQMSQLDMNLELKLLPPEEAAALTELTNDRGRMSIAAFERLHGAVRQMGPGKMEREEPWLDPVSPAEALWYRGFIYRGFEEIKEDQIEEVYYVPEEFYTQIPPTEDAGQSSIQVLDPLDESTIQEHELIDDLVDMVDDMTTMISFAQIKPLHQDKINRFDSFFQQSNPQRLELLFTLAWEMGLFRATDAGAKPARKAVEWLKQGREQQLRHLANSWRGCSWNELYNTPGLQFEGSGWTNDSVAARNAIIAALPDNFHWYDSAAFVTYIKENNPDFQRPGGNYNTWYIREHESGEYLRGFESWDGVEGRLLRFVIKGPLYWLGLIRLRQSDDSTNISFQLTSRGLDWLKGRPVKRDDITVPIVVGNDATLFVPTNANQYNRFQIARIADLVSAKPNKPYEYWLTPNSLATAQEQGIDPSRLLEFLKDASGRPIPAGTKRAIERWVERGFEARIERVFILKVREESILEKLRENPKTRPFIATLGDLAAVIKPDDWQKFRQAAAGLGLLIDYSIEVDQG